ncbi:MAG: preprotein translocase subunit SecE [Solirubrobacteraceae bacterium]
MARNRKRAKDRRTRRPAPVAGARVEPEQQRSQISAGERDQALRPIGPAGRDDVREAAPVDDGADPDAQRLDADGVGVADPELDSRSDDELPSEFGELPGALAHAAPDVELAEAQLALGRPELARDGEADFEQDELEAEDELGRGGAALVAAGKSAPQRRLGAVNRLITFLQGSWRELQRVQWPDRRQVVQATGVVIGFVIVAGVFLGVADTLSGHVVNLVLTGKW